MNQLYSQIDYETNIQPIFDNYCISCHEFPIRAGALELNNYNNLMLGESNNGPVVIPSNPDSSLLYRVLLRDSVIVPNEPICCRMPKDADPLTESQISLIYEWIQEGAEENSLEVNKKMKLNNSTKIIHNFPNPFNPSTTFKFNLKKTSDIDVFIYDNLGIEIKHLSMNGVSQGINSIHWDGTNKNGNRISAGVYFYLFKTNHDLISNKMIFLK
tara:strand:+ start:3179 stop:3820 length:642 start_codon:yes stop_codon:yes gene_type:complete